MRKNIEKRFFFATITLIVKLVRTSSKGDYSMTSFDKYIATDIQGRFEFRDYGHTLEILHESFPEEWREIQDCLRKLKLTVQDVVQSGGNESPIPK